MLDGAVVCRGQTLPAVIVDQARLPAVPPVPAAAGQLRPFVAAPVAVASRDPQVLYQAARNAWAYAKHCIRQGLVVEIVGRVVDRARTIRQNRWYWSAVLGEISSQVRLDGVRYSREAWHEYFKREVLGYDFTFDRDAGEVERTLRSTRALSVREMQDYLDEVCAIAACDMGVVFDGGWWE